MCGLTVHRKAVLLLLAVLIVVGGCTPPTVAPAPRRFYALNLPATSAPAASDGRPMPGVSHSVRLLLDDRPLAHSQTLVGEMDQGSLLEPGHTMTMRFSAPQAFRGVAVALYRAGPGPTSARLSLWAGEQTGSPLATLDTGIAQHAWVELRTGPLPAGAYVMQVSDATGQGLYWRGTTVAPDGDLWAGYRDQGVPFRLPQTPADIPSYDGGSLSIPVNARAERIYILGGRSTYDYGIGHWGDYEARADASDRQFIGDQDGELEVVYSRRHG